jgi:hypothetical protein
MLGAFLVALAIIGSDRDASAQCSVLDDRPCTPSFCSVFDSEPCIPDIDYPLGQNLQLNVSSREQHAAKHPEQELRTIRDVFMALRACWTPPAGEQGRPGTQLSVRVSFRRDGTILGEPRWTYTSAGTPPKVRQVYRDAVKASLDLCAPLPLSAGLGGALAGRPIAIRFIDDRPRSETHGERQQH